MPIKSYIIIPNQSQLQELKQELSELEGCAVHAAENEDVLVLVTETPNEEKDKVLLNQIEASEYLQHVSFVAGFD